MALYSAVKPAAWVGETDRLVRFPRQAYKGLPGGGLGKGSQPSGRKSFDAGCALLLSNPRDDVRGILAVDSRYRRHVAEIPVMLVHAPRDGEIEGEIGVMRGLVDPVDQRRALVGAARVRPRHWP